MAKGLYFVANDAIYELTVAFLKSFRIHNPSLPLCLIPYNDDIRRTSSLAETYNFSVFSDAAVFERCAAISRRFHGGKVLGHYRKLAAWHGPFDEFIYIDTDTVVTSGVDFVYEFLKEHAFVVSSADIPEITNWVWKDTIHAAGVLNARQIAFAASTGFLCSSKAALNLEEAERKLPAALALAPHMELRAVEQPFLNYLIVTSGKSYDSIWNIVNQTGARQFPIERWGGEKHDFLRFENCCTPHFNVLFVHWAGEWHPPAREEKFYAFLRRLGYKGPLPTMRLFMRNRRLWRYYRHRPEHLFSRRYLSGTKPAAGPPLAEPAGAGQLKALEA